MNSLNVGVQDQIMALRWVNQTIEVCCRMPRPLAGPDCVFLAQSFGGDPGLVTIQGQASGAVSVCAHLVSKLRYDHPSRPPRRGVTRWCSTGLFHRAVMQSLGCHRNPLPWDTRNQFIAALQVYVQQRTGSPLIGGAYGKRFVVVLKWDTHTKELELSGVTQAARSATWIVCRACRPSRCSTRRTASSSTSPSTTTWYVPALSISPRAGAWVDGTCAQLVGQPQHIIAGGGWNRVPLMIGAVLCGQALLTRWSDSECACVCRIDDARGASVLHDVVRTPTCRRGLDSHPSVGFPTRHTRTTTGCTTSSG
jgi:hypothetical protein